MDNIHFKLLKTPECSRVTPYGIVYRIQASKYSTAAPEGSVGGFMLPGTLIDSNSWIGDNAVVIGSTLRNSRVCGTAVVVLGDLTDSFVTGNARLVETHIVNTTVLDDVTMVRCHCYEEATISGTFYGRNVEFTTDCAESIFVNSGELENQNIHTVSCRNKGKGPIRLELTVDLYNGLLYQNGMDPVPIRTAMEKSLHVASGLAEEARRDVYRTIVFAYIRTVTDITSPCLSTFPYHVRHTLADIQKLPWLHEEPWRDQNFLNIKII